MLPSVLRICPILGCLLFITSEASQLTCSRPNDINSWLYAGPTGPEHWCKLANGCCGTKQSPIALGVDSKISHQNPFVFYNYNVVPTTVTLQNNGRNIIVTLDESESQRTISGGGLRGTYILDTIHFHWGSNSRIGSEHKLYGQTYPLELHLVHYNSRFPDYITARDSGDSDAVAVLGIVLYLAIDPNPGLQTFIDQLNRATYSGQSAKVTIAFAVSDLLPIEQRVFFRYHGSLTSPGCNEAVVWTVFLQPVPVSECQMHVFRSLLTSSEGEPAHKMVDNYRPLHPHNNRKIQLITAE